MASLHKALGEGGRVILVDFKRIEAVTKEETLKNTYVPARRPSPKKLSPPPASHCSRSH